MHSSDGPFSSVSRILPQLRSAYVTWLCFGLVIGIHTLVESSGGPVCVSRWFENFGLSREGCLSGKVWQILSYGFLHGSWLHVGINGLFVLVIGSRVEFIAGHALMMRVVPIGIIGGGLCHLLLGSNILVGLSGGCVALLLLLTTLSPESKMFPLPISGKSLGLGILLAELMLALIDPALNLPGLSALGRKLVESGMASWFVMGHACHFGGGLAGWMVGRWLLRSRVTLDRLRRERARREAG